jgi:2'-5' RNA ligase
VKLFLAVDLAPGVKDGVAGLIAGHAKGPKWVRPQGLHLTLVFFGERPEEALPALKAKSQVVAARHRPFELTLGAGGTFGDPPRVLWLGVSAGLDPLRTLALELEAAHGVTREHAEYAPHLTLARSATPRGDPQLAKIALGLAGAGFGASLIDRCTLYQSAGGRYLALETFPLVSP